MAKVRSPRIPPPISAEEAHRLVKIADKAAGPYLGNVDELESAIGMLLIGRLIGWKPLLIAHSPKTIKKYEAILGIQVREEFPEVGPFADKLMGWKIAKTVSNFWKAVSGDTSIPGRRTIDEP